MDGFEEFYKRWPRKIGRAAARLAWQKTAHIRPPLPVLLAAIDAYVQWREQLAAKRDFVPALLYPATWLNQERWTDEYDTVAAPGAVITPQIDERIVAQREAERMAVMRAHQAWADVTAAAVQRSLPLGGWGDPLTLDALRAIGGFQAVCNADSRKALHQLARAFEQAWIAPENVEFSGNVVALKRRAA